MENGSRKKTRGMNEGKGSAGVPPAVFGVPPNTSSPDTHRAGRHSAQQQVKDIVGNRGGVQRVTLRTTHQTGKNPALSNLIQANPTKSHHFETFLFHAKINPAQWSDFHSIVKVVPSNQTNSVKAGLPRRSRFGEGGSNPVKVNQSSLSVRGARPVYAHVIQNEQLAINSRLNRVRAVQTKLNPRNRTLNQLLLREFDELCVHVAVGDGYAPNNAGACQRDRAAAIGPIRVNKRGVGMLVMDGLGHFMFAARRDGADNRIGPVRELARRVKGGIINHFDIAVGTGLPILLLADVGGEIVSWPSAAAGHKQQKSRYHPFHNTFITGLPPQSCKKNLRAWGRAPSLSCGTFAPPGSIVKGRPRGVLFLILIVILILIFFFPSETRRLGLRLRL